jgi:hypothetical protein
MTFLLALALLLAPASQPTTQPAAPLPSERVVENAKLRLHFAVPKPWKEVQQQSAEVYVFQLPATGDARRYNPSLIITARETKNALPAEVDGRREAIQQRNPEAKFVQDAAATLAGHDGWTFLYDTKVNQTVTSNGKSHQEQIVVKVRDQLTIIDGRAIEFVLMSDDKGLVIRSRLIDRVTSTLVVDP